MSLRVIMAFAIIASAIVFGTQHASAEETSNSANTLKISPVRSDIEVKAGTSKTVEVIVTNVSGAPIKVRPVTNDFIAGDERGTPALILDAKQFAPTHSLKRYIQPLEDVIIEPGKGKKIAVVIKVPKDAKSGGYFGAVRFAPSSPDDGGEVNLSASVASLILMTVPGPVTEKLTLTNFDIQQGGRNGTLFQSANDLQLALRLESKSNIQVAPFGKISVKQGDKIVYDYDFNSSTDAPRDMILPDSARRWDVPLKNIGSFGHYTVYATLTYGKSNQTIETSRSFWVIPWIVIIAAVAVVLLFLGIILAIILLIRRRKRRVRMGGGHHGHGGYRRY